MRTILVFVAGLFLVGTAQPATLWKEHIGNWEIWSYSNDQNGTFGHCSASAPYKSGILLFFGVNKNLDWSMGFGAPSWQTKEGTQYNISYWIDNAPAEFTTAKAIGGGVVLVNLKDSAALFNTFRRGNTLFVNAQGTTVPFALTNTSQVLAYLLQCAANSGAKPAPAVAATPNLFGTPTSSSNTRPQPKPQPAPATTTSAAADKAEATSLAANILSELGITGFKFLTPEESKGKGGDATWIIGSTAGAIDVLPNVTAPDEVGPFLIGRNAKECKKAFASGSMPVEGEGTLARLFTRCGVGKEAFVAYYLVLPRKVGGVYLIGTYGYEQEDKVSAMEAGIRSVAFRALPK